MVTQFHSLLSVALAFILRLLDHCLLPSNHHPWSTLPTINTEHPRSYHHLLLLDVSGEQVGEHLVALVSAVPVDAVGDEGLRHGTEGSCQISTGLGSTLVPRSMER